MNLVNFGWQIMIPYNVIVSPVDEDYLSLLCERCGTNILHETLYLQAIKDWYDDHDCKTLFPEY